jgi:hypothetical protein
MTLMERIAKERLETLTARRELLYSLGNSKDNRKWIGEVEQEIKNITLKFPQGSQHE